MEHDFEKTIKEKIIATETSPVAWEKELVWSRIGPGRTGGSGNYIFYYAAASIVLAAALFFYSIEFTKRKQLDLQLKSVELAIEQAKSRQLNSKAVNESVTKATTCVEPRVENKATETISSAQTPLRNTKRKQPAEQTLAIENKIEKKDPTILVAEEKIIPVSILEEISRTLQYDPVRAIIGREAENKVSAHASKEKKLRFYLFQQGEETEPSKNNQEPFNLLSRINQH